MQSKSRIRRNIAEEPIESKSTSLADGFSDIGNSLVKNLWEDLLVGSAKKIPEQIAGGKKNEEKGQMLEEGEEVSLKKTQKETVRISEGHSEYFRQIKNSESITVKNEQIIIKQRVDEIMRELKKLAKSSKEMSLVFKEVIKEEMPAQPGQYHLNFFSWLLNVVQNARIRIEEGANWLQMFASRKKQKQYWSMFKKHGTTFGLSQERTTATQTG